MLSRTFSDPRIRRELTSNQTKCVLKKDDRLASFTYYDSGLSLTSSVSNECDYRTMSEVLITDPFPDSMEHTADCPRQLSGTSELSPLCADKLPLQSYFRKNVLVSASNLRIRSF